MRIITVKFPSYKYDKDEGYKRIKGGYDVLGYYVESESIDIYKFIIDVEDFVKYHNDIKVEVHFDISKLYVDKDIITKTIYSNNILKSISKFFYITKYESYEGLIYLNKEYKEYNLHYLI